MIDDVLGRVDHPTAPHAWCDDGPTIPATLDVLFYSL
jgi:hypothetical protein